jgi:hypothetical protein
VHQQLQQQFEWVSQPLILQRLWFKTNLLLQYRNNLINLSPFFLCCRVATAQTDSTNQMMGVSGTPWSA